MNSSLKIVTDQNGYFRHPDGYPLVVIFDSKHSKDKTPSEISWQDPVVGLHTPESNEGTAFVLPNNAKAKAKADAQPLTFVNISRPAKHDRRTKKLIRTHVTQDLRRRTRGHETSVDKVFDVGSANAHSATLCEETLKSNWKEVAVETKSIPRQPFALLDPFITFPIRMEPYMYTLLHRYLLLSSTVMVKKLGHEEAAAQGWFSLAVTDAALFHSILCGSALYMDIVTGRRESLEKFRHMKEAVHVLSARLQDPRTELSDSTLLAVAHLADFESMAGNFTNWYHHMDGLYKMVQIRGGLEALNVDLKTKIWRADVTGCLGTLSKPRFSAVDNLDSALGPFLINRPLCNGLRNTVDSFIMNSDFIDILGGIQCLNSAISHTTMDPATADRIIVSIRYHLLLFQSIGYTTFQNAVITESCCLGAFVYLKTVHDFYFSLQVGEFPVSLSIHGAMNERLKACLDMAEANMPQTRALFLWITFIGGVAAARTESRAWFVARLVKTLRRWRISSWEDARSSLITFLWVDKIHENPCRALWDEAATTINMLFEGES